MPARIAAAALLHICALNLGSSLAPLMDASTVVCMRRRRFCGQLCGVRSFYDGAVCLGIHCVGSQDWIRFHVNAVILSCLGWRFGRMLALYACS